MIQFACPSCQKHYKVADEMAGKKGKCKECGQLMMIPVPKPPEPEIVAEDPYASEDPYAAEQQPQGSALASDSLPPFDAPGTGNTANPFDMPLPSAGSPAAGTADGTDAMWGGAPLPAGSAFPAGSVPMSATTNTGGNDLSGTTPDLSFQITQRPDFSMVQIDLDHGGKIFAEPSAMVSMSPNIKLEAGFKGGLGKTFGRMLGGESLIINTFTAQDGPGEILFAGGAAGDLAYLRLEDSCVMLQRGAFMLNGPGVEVTGKWQGAKGFFSGEGLVLLKASGTGDLFFNSYGAILEVDVTDEYIVDTGYIVAFEESLDYRVTVLPGLRSGGKIKSFFFGGEGLVAQFRGNGRVWIQTRQISSFLSWVNAFRPTKNN
ncbi:TIGR00266 family protein [Stieleria sp. JC731]|uniref:TIGR00266 family protein n=1 Tax=Pirellulaceae TaxID=2691357 RepID=UPI001E5A1678|nr:TIGR00266 family protein [Stieleria sp. JC731]MCC9602928.1 TIGR00266 family protein [Stieleria sp. JC731]